MSLPKFWQPVIASLVVILIAFTLLGPSDTTTPTFADVPPQIVATPSLSESCPGGVCAVRGPCSTQADAMLAAPAASQVVESVSYSEPVYYTSAPAYTSSSVSYGSTGVSYSPSASTASYGSTGSVAYPAPMVSTQVYSTPVSYGSAGSSAYAPRTPVRNFVRAQPLRRLAAARPVRSVLRRAFCR